MKFPESLRKILFKLSQSHLNPLNYPRTLLRSIIFCSLVAICLSQCYGILEDFIANPTVINFRRESPSLVTIMPGLTICNNNRLSLRKLLKRNATIKATIREDIRRDIERSRSLIDRVEFQKFRDLVQEVFDFVGYSASREAKESTLNDLFDKRPDIEPFIEWLGCTQTWPDSYSCSKITRIESMTNRHCITLMHEGAMLNDLTHRASIFNDSERFSGYKGIIEPEKKDLYARLNLDDFSTTEVIRIMINFDPEDYGDLTRQIGARITFHANNHVANTRDLDFFITRGFRYDFSIDRVGKNSIAKPKKGCTDYKKKNLNHFAQQIDPRVPLSMATCFQNCIVKSVLSSSRCWPNTMPYFRNDSLDPQLNMKLCDWLVGPQHKSIFDELLRIDNVRSNLRSGESRRTDSWQADDWIKWRYASQNIKKYRTINKYCFSHCSLGCKLAYYTVSLSKSVWPTDVNILLDDTGAMKNRRHCCALISIKFAHYHTTIHESLAKHDTPTTIGSVGGVLAVWLGLSVMSIYRVMLEMVNLIIGKYSIEPRSI